MTAGRPAAARPPTFTEQARRAQLIRVTIQLIAAHGYAGCSLQRIAESAGITKAAVIYHFASKRAVIRAAYDTVIARLAEHVGALIAQAETPAGQVDAYVRGLIGYMAAHPDHVRVIVEALDDDHDTGIADRPGSPERWRALADLVEAAKTAGAYRAKLDSRTTAIMIGGAIDAVVAESLTDRSYDLRAAADAVIGMLHGTALRSA
ncbi:TetR/AcrR family transcriptional regulator [Micromonospora sp. CPCC 205561]|uniref:TetR/AcrR family transcriptional regulator n=1 Tax=Micromonospora sp. CPCC 205561 TaxID=3122407 RepID=UPI002FF0806D